MLVWFNWWNWCKTKNDRKWLWQSVNIGFFYCLWLFVYYFGCSMKFRDKRTNLQDKYKYSSIEIASKYFAANQFNSFFDFFFHFGASRFSSFRTHIYTQSSEQNKKKLIINNITIITTKEAQINSINRNALHEYNFSGMSTRKHTRNQKFKFAYEKSVFFCFFHWFVYQSFAFACRTPLISQIVYVHALEMNLH